MTFSNQVMVEKFLAALKIQSTHIIFFQVTEKITKGNMLSLTIQTPTRLKALCHAVIDFKNLALCLACIDGEHRTSSSKLSTSP
jgi:hypothetical protein